MSNYLSRMTNAYKSQKMTWTIKVMTIREYLLMSTKIDVRPIHQRIDVQNYRRETSKQKAASKRQGIIGSIFRGTDIGEIKINERTALERFKFPQQFESIDGGNRKRSILAFYHGDFSINPYENPDVGYKTFNELTEEEKETFLNYEMRFIIYTHLTPEQKAMLWATTNNVTPVNHQEFLNGMGDIPVANLIRETARSDRATKTHCHKLFETKFGKEDNVIGEYLTFDPHRLTYDRLVARIATIIHNGSKPTNCDDRDIEALYYDRKINQDVADTIRRKTVECLDFMLEMAEQKGYSNGGKKLTEDECIMLMRLWFNYTSLYKKFTITNYELYYEQWRKAWLQFDKNDPEDYGEELIDSYDGKEKRARWALFKDNHNKGGVDRWNDNIKWIENKFLDHDTLISRGILVIKERRKTLDSDTREKIWLSQNKKCFIDGKRLEFEDAHAAHIVALADGGTNNVSNIRMVRASHNTKMGTMHLEDYKKMWNKKAA